MTLDPKPAWLPLGILLGLLVASAPATGAVEAPQEPLDCAQPQTGLALGACEMVADLLATLGLPETRIAALYQDVHFNGQQSSTCVRHPNLNASVRVETWLIWVEVGTLQGSTRNPIVATNVVYPWVVAHPGSNSC